MSETKGQPALPATAGRLLPGTVRPHGKLLHIINQVGVWEGFCVRFATKPRTGGFSGGFPDHRRGERYFDNLEQRGGLFLPLIRLRLVCMAAAARRQRFRRRRWKSRRGRRRLRRPEGPSVKTATARPPQPWVSNLTAGGIRADADIDQSAKRGYRFGGYCRFLPHQPVSPATGG